LKFVTLVLICWKLFLQNTTAFCYRTW